MAHELVITDFRAAFSVFADSEIYPDPMLQIWWDMAICNLSPDDNCVISGNCLQSALYLLMAHIGMLMTRIAEGNTTAGAVNSATIDKVSVSFTVPPITNGWQAWLAQTPYGLQLWAMLLGASAGGFYIGGAREQRAIRRVGGRFR